MKQLHVVFLFVAVALTATTAWGQYGLYGSPDMLDLPPVESRAGSPYGYASPGANPYQTGPYAASMAQPAPGIAQQAYDGRLGPVRTVSAAEPPAPPPTPSPSDTTGPSIVDQMLSESYDYGGCYAPACGAPPPGYDCGLSGCQAPIGCGPSMGCCTEMCCMPTWYVYANGLVMGRNHPNRLWTTYETGNEPNQLVNTTDIGMPWHGGWEGGVGRYFCCGQWALEASYWGLGSVTGEISSRDVFGGLVSTTLHVGNIQFGTDPHDPLVTLFGTDLFDNAEEHILRRRNEVHNIELNLVRNRFDCGCNGVDCNWSVGVRYFRFEEALSFASVAAGHTWTEDNGAWSAMLADRVQNNLVGFQLGCDMNLDLGCNFSLFVTPAVGIYGNSITHDFRLQRGDGVAAVPDPSSGVTGTYPVHSSDSALSFLSEVDLGLNWAFDTRWEAFIGYRVVFATGIALADNQIPTYVVDIPEIADIDHNGDLVYHGAFMGATLKF